MRDASPYLEVITGPMFSGKTTELLRQYEVFRRCGFSVQVFKWTNDGRYGNGVVTHTGTKFRDEDIFHVKESSDIRNLLKKETNVVLVDEAQFLDSGLVELLDGLVYAGKIVVVTTLSTDFSGKSFGVAPELLAKADHVTSLTARCMFLENGKPCLKPATRTARIVKAGQQVLVGGEESYQPRCRMHHKV